MDMTIDTCPGCHLPAHASETDDDGYHPRCHGDVANAYLDVIETELVEIGANDLLPYVTAARQHDDHAIAVVAAYIAERDAQLARGRSHKWLVSGPKSAALGTCYASRERALKAQERWGADTHTITPGYGNRYGWSAITAHWCEQLAQHAVAVAS